MRYYNKTSMGVLDKIGLTGIMGGATALGGAIAGAIKSAKFNNKARALTQKERDDNVAWWNMKKATDYTQRTDAQAIFNKQRDILADRYKTARATNVVAGGTDASEALQKEAANDAMAQTMGAVAENASAQLDAAEQQYRATDAALAQQQIAGLYQQGSDAAAAGSQAIASGINLVGIGTELNKKKS